MPEARVDLKGWYVYPLMDAAGTARPVLGAALNAETVSSVQIYQGFDFELIQAQFVSTGAFSIIFGTTSVQYMQNWVRAANILGTGILVHRFPESMVFPRGSVIAVRLRNDTALSNTITIDFEGRNV